ncbi:family 78 glycoside hydrolase catalytic domain [Streptomyces sp. WMMC500]|uniref:alpha-L-rhamnosidase n=1 Tax=Streptomyces sp. WMMC500 TaxID=3015154 RepID=UPI00248C1BB8|nr:alpha-L-rhamnosidase [Streptomyces sp. WMMC500]WBB61622.1 family 78 glycoside hydrolase catalytic domain [Streptomyces sp. WMMC500]
MAEATRRGVLGAVAGAAVLSCVPLRAATAAGSGTDGRAGLRRSGTDGRAGLRPFGLTAGHLTDPLGIETAAPRLGWRLAARGAGRAQTAYRILVATGPGLPEGGRADVWDSGRVESADQSGVRYGGPPLRPRTRYYWAVETWDERGRPGPRSEVARFETALPAGDAGWRAAAWIGTGADVARPTRVLPPGPAGPDPLRPGGTLGQLFASAGPMAGVTVLLEVAAGEPAGCTMTLRRDGPDGAVVAVRELTDLRGDAFGSAQGRLDLGEPAGPGRYFLQLSAVRGSVGWQTAAYTRPGQDGYPDGTAYANGEPVPAKDRWLCTIPPPPPANPLLRTEFRLPGEPVSARLYVTGLGHAVARVNGRRVGSPRIAALSPVATDYDRRLLYTTHDVTALLRRGGNALGVALGRGAFATRSPDTDGTNLARWVAEPRLRARLEVTLAGGQRVTVATGPGWTWADGPTTYEGLHAGESYDARRAAALAGWDRPGYAARGWRRAVEVPGPGGAPEAYPGVHTRAGTPVRPARVTAPAEGVRLLDFGAVLTGWVRLRGRLPAGARVRFRYGERLGDDGRVHAGTPGGVENIAVDGRLQVDEYTATGRGIEEWQPSFSYKGFQYVEVTGAPPGLDVVAVPVASEVAGTMDLALDHPELQWIADAFGRTARNGLLGYPGVSPYTKAGWFGAARNAAVPTLHRFGVARLFGHWLDDIRAAQAPSGALPLLAPLGADAAPVPVSPSYTSLYPHLVRRFWMAYGDASVPAKHFEPVGRYLEWLLAALAEQGDILDDVFGDWYPPGKAVGDHPRGPEGGRLVGTAYAVQSLRDGVALAGLLGDEGTAGRWRAGAERVVRRFNEEFLDAAAGVYRTDREAGYRQASNAIPLALDLVPARHRAAVAGNLAARVEANGRAFDTGSMGTGALVYALSDHGRHDLAVAVLGRSAYPSYGYLRGLGATTFWESWERHSRGRNDTTVGAPAAWLVERAAGAEALAPGWARFRVAPRPYGALPAAGVALDTVRGRVAVRWRRTGRELALAVEVPVNAVAEVELPDGRRVKRGSGRHRFACAVPE